MAVRTTLLPHELNDFLHRWLEGIPAAERAGYPSESRFGRKRFEFLDFPPQPTEGHEDRSSRPVQDDHPLDPASLLFNVPRPRDQGARLVPKLGADGSAHDLATPARSVRSTPA